MGQKLRTTPELIANTLFETGGFILRPDRPFVWASGQLAPVYCDNRLMLSSPSARDQITEAFLEGIEGMEIDVVVGVATAGIAYAALVADRLGLPMAYVRGQPKGHGRRNQIEGKVPAGSRVVIIEDLIATGGSSLHVANAVSAAAEVTPLLILAIMSYKLKGVEDRFAEADIPMQTLTDFDVLLQVGLEGRRVTASQVDRLRVWQQDVDAWAARNQRRQAADR
ncbi:MAG: orotate phosphoribosyltransferase [Bacteroidota bacterium]|nr:orotate phosphoribosyltransferase [Bacteroidota bacterium]